MRNDSPTPLDEALDAARQDPEKSGIFYNLFLNTDLFLPVRPPDPGDAADVVNLHIVQDGDGLFLPAFDTLKRLQVWAKGPTANVRVRCHILLQSLGKEYQMVLNAGTGKARGFGTEELEWLRGIVDEALPKPDPGGS